VRVRVRACVCVSASVMLIDAESNTGHRINVFTVLTFSISVVVTDFKILVVDFTHRKLLWCDAQQLADISTITTQIFKQCICVQILC
jgi:hypothetical protein